MLIVSVFQNVACIQMYYCPKNLDNGSNFKFIPYLNNLQNFFETKKTKQNGPLSWADNGSKLSVHDIIQ